MLYEAMYELLVTEGPLLNVYADRLPAEQTAEVDVAHIPQGGGSPQRYLGSEPVVDGRPAAGVEHDGGVLWHVTNVQFQARSESAEAVMDVADRIRDVLVQYAGTSVFKGGEEIIATSPRPPTTSVKTNRSAPFSQWVSRCLWHKPA